MLISSFLKPHLHAPSDVLIPTILRLSQTVLTVLTRNGELLLNRDLFPYFMQFLAHTQVMDFVNHTAPISVKTCHAVCMHYLDYIPPELEREDIGLDRDGFVEFISTCMNENVLSEKIVVGCNCVRVLFPRDWTIGFGPYPPSCYSILNKHNNQRNITPTSIKMFPLSLLRNLSGLYLTNAQQRSGTWLNGSSLAAYHRINALHDNIKGKLSLRCTDRRKDVGVVGTVDRSEIFATKNAIVAKQEAEGMLDMEIIRNDKSFINSTCTQSS